MRSSVTLDLLANCCNVYNTCSRAVLVISLVTTSLKRPQKTPICAFVLSTLDYCNALPFGSPKHLLDRLQKVQNNAARLIYRSSKFHHVTPLLHTLHWLPIEKRIDFKLASLCFKSLNGSASTYISDPLHLNWHSSSAVPFFRRHPGVQNTTPSHRV